VGHFEWLACFMLLLLGWLFVPFYLRSGVYTMPEFLERRFNPPRAATSPGLSIIGYVLTKISVTLFAGGIVMREVTGVQRVDQRRHLDRRHRIYPSWGACAP